MLSNDEPAREKPEDELLDSTAALRALPHGVVICDRAGIVRFINPAAARLLRVDVDQCLNLSLAEFPHGAELSKCAVGELSKIYLHSEWVRFRILPVHSAKNPSQQIGRLILFDDWIPERESSRNYLGVISHALRAPLTTVIGNIELLNRELLGPISADQRDSLNILARLGMHMRDVVNDVMTLSSIENGSIWVEPEPISLIGIIQEILLTFEEQYRDRAIKLLISIPDDLPPVAGELYAVRAIFSKLLDNAYRYTLPGGQIIIRALCVDRRVRIDIEDTGIGISDSAKPHIFVELVHDYDNPFSSPNQYSHGIGMSLVIVKKLVDLYGGTIWFESTVGRGSTFSFMLPLSETV